MVSGEQGLKEEKRECGQGCGELETLVGHCKGCPERCNMKISALKIAFSSSKGCLYKNNPYICTQIKLQQA